MHTSGLLNCEHILHRKKKLFFLSAVEKIPSNFHTTQCWTDTGDWELVTFVDINVGGGRRFLDHSHPLCTKLHQAPPARVRGELFVAVVREYTRFGERGQQITVEMVDGRGSINTYLCIN